MNDYYFDRRLSALRKNSALILPDYGIYGSLYTCGASYANGISASNVLTLTQIAGNWKNVIPLSSSANLVLKSDSSLWGWGSDINFGLYNKTVSSIIYPPSLAPGNTNQSGMFCAPQLQLYNDYKSAAGSGNCVVLIKADGTMYSYGSNEYGTRGIGSFDSTYMLGTVTQIGSASNWVKVVAGNNFFVAINSAGNIFSWGNNSLGTLGLGDLTDRNVPVQVGTGVWSDIYAGYANAAAVDTSSYKFGCVWGSNSYGQLKDDTVTYPKVVEPTSFGDVYVKQIAFGAGYKMMILNISGGRLYGRGLNSYGQLGLGNNTSPVLTTSQVGDGWSYISCGYAHSIALDSNNIAYSSGDGSSGQHGNGSTSNKNTFTQMSATVCKYAQAGALTSFLTH